jgi:hypothetical protein
MMLEHCPFFLIMIKKSVYSIADRGEKQESYVSTPIEIDVLRAKNNPTSQNVERPIVWELRKQLREKYPQSKFQTVYLSKKPFHGEYTVHYASKDIHLPFSEFCENFGIDPSSIETEQVALTDSDEHAPKSVNQFKSDLLYDVGQLQKNAMMFKKIIASYALKCSLPIDYAEQLITPVEWVRYAKDTSKKIYKTAFLIGSHFFTPDSIDSKGEVYTAKMPIYTVHHYLYPLQHLKNSKRDEQLLEGKEHFILLEGQNDCNCFNYHFKDTIYFAVTVGGVKNWINAKVQFDFLKSLRPSAKFFTLFDNDDAGRTTHLHFAQQLLWNDIFKTPLKEKFDVCDAFQMFPYAKSAILAELARVFHLAKTEIKISGEMGHYLSSVLQDHNIPIDINSFRNTIVVSNTGSGKGRIIEELCKKGLNICIFPINMLVEQMTERIRNNGTNVFTYYGENPSLETLSLNQTIVTNYASFPKLCQKIYEKYGDLFFREINLLADEIHNFTTSSSPNFALKEYTRCVELFAKFASVTGFTGTFVPNTHPNIARLNVLEVDIPVKKPFLQLITCDNTIYATIESIREHAKNGEKVAVLLNNKGAKLDKLKSGLKGIKMAVLNSDTKDCDDFKDIIKNEKLSDDIQVLISTTVLKEGTNILNEIAHVYIDTKKFSLIEIWQFINRFRTSIKNGNLKVHIMCTQFDEIYEKRPAFDFLAEATKFRSVCQKLIKANAECELQTMQEELLDGYQLFDKYPIFYNKIDNLLEINELHLSNIIYQNQTIHTYTNAKTFESVAKVVGFDFVGVKEYELEPTTILNKTEIKAIEMDAKLAKELRKVEYETILQDLKTILEAEKNENFTGLTVLEHIERMKTVKTLTPVEKIVYEGLQKIRPFYEDAEKLIHDVEIMVKTPKKSQFSLLKRRLRARNFVKSYVMDTKCEIVDVVQSIIANVICGDIYISGELKEIVLSAMAGHATFEPIAKKIKEAKRIDKVLNILEAFFTIKIGKCDNELRYRLSPIDFYSDSDKKPKDYMEPVFDLF